MTAHQEAQSITTQNVSKHEKSEDYTTIAHPF